ncbi:MAG: VanZ family protein [Odoribacter sp.]|nr:VanZ family protein [Odoribacter sp.]
MKAVARFISQWWPSLIVLAVIIYGTWVPKPIDPDNIPAIPGIDKIIHAIMMGGFTGSILFDFRRSGRTLTRRPIVVTAVAVALFSIADEVIQGLLPIGRPSDPLDLLADWGGILIAVFTAPPAVNACFRSRRQRQQP